MAVRLIEPALRVLLDNPAGPVGLDLNRRAVRVEEQARGNASGAFIDIQTGDLLAGLRHSVGVDEHGLRALVGSDAIHRSFLYPRIVARAGDEPGGWLIDALSAAG